MKIENQLSLLINSKKNQIRNEYETRKELLFNKQLEEKDKEIERLTAESTEWESKCYKYQEIIDELEKWLNKEQKRYREYLSERATNDSEYNSQYATQCGLAQLDVVLDKLKELKEGKNSHEN